MNVLITGGYGFVGSHLVERFVKEKHNVTVIDNLSTGLPENINREIKAFHLSVEDEKCARIFEETAFDVVIHLATKDDPGAVEDNEVLRANNTGLSNILYLAQKHQVSKLIILSPYPIYGRQSSLPISEEAELAPREAAGFHYLTREMLCAEYRRQGLKVVALRVGSIYGPRQNNLDSFINRIITAGLSGLEFDEKLAREFFSTQQKDYIFVSDVVDAIYRVSENEIGETLNVSSGQGVTNQEIWQICARHFSNLTNTDALKPSPETEENKTAPDYVLDNKKALYELEWAPKYGLEEGIAKTIAWAENKAKNNNQLTKDQEKTAVVKKKKGYTWGRFNHDLETTVLFAFFALFNYLLHYQLSISLDLFIFYILLVSTFYGLRQSLTAIALSAVAHVWYKFTFQEMQALKLVSDTNTILYLTMYFIIGIGVGYVVDKMRLEKRTLEEELAFAKSEVDFINEMQQKCLQVKNSMQYMLENYEDNFGAIFNVVTRLNQVIPERIFNETAAIFSKIFKAQSVGIYYVSSPNNWLRLVASVGPTKYGRSIKVNQYNFLASVLNDQSTYINKSLEKQHPTLCAPIFVGPSTKAVVFLDEIEFTHLTQHFTNLLKVMTYLISSTIAKAHEYEKATGDKKYFPHTSIMKEHWFNNLIAYHRERQNDTDQPFVLLAVVMDKIKEKDYARLDSQISALIREVDYVGEIKSGQLGIIASNLDADGIPALQSRLLKHGIKVEVAKLEGLPA